MAPIGFVDTHGTFGGDFTASLEAGDIVFSYSDSGGGIPAVPWVPAGFVDSAPRRGRPTGARPDSIVEGSDLFVRIARLVENRHPSRMHGVVGVREAGGYLMPQHSDGQYALRSEEELLAVAREVGPLFGLYGADAADLASGVVREPVEAWVEAAGVMLFASRLEACRTGGATWDVLNDDVVYTTAKIRVEDEDFDSLAANYVFDEGVAEPYRSLLESSATTGTLEAYRDAGLGVLSSGTLVSLEQTSGLDALRCPGWSFDRPGPGRSGLSRLRCFVNGAMPLPSSIPSAGATVSHERMASEPGLKGMLAVLAEAFENALLEVHQAGKGAAARVEQVNGPTYKSMLERIWADFGARRSSARVAICAECGRPFYTLRDGQQRYCPKGLFEPWETACKDAHDHREKARRRHYASSVKRAVEELHGDGAPFGTADVREELSGAIPLDEVERALGAMVRKGALVEDLSTGARRYARSRPR